MDEQVGEEEEEVGAAETGQQMVEDVPHRPVKVFSADCNKHILEFSCIMIGD